MFTIFLSDKPGESKFTMGGLPRFLQNRNLQIQYHHNKVIEVGDDDYASNYWSIEFTQAKLDQQSLESEAAEVVLDSGCTINYARKSFIDEILKYSGLKNCQRFGKTSHLFCDCSKEEFEALPDLELDVANGSISLGREHWVQFSSEMEACAI